MTHVVFYGKPGCLTNVRQKGLLRELGHTVIECDLLREPWTVERLSAFMTGLPVAHWFNASSPRVKSGEVEPSRLHAKSALRLLIDDPLLIRRPLIETPYGLSVGFFAFEDLRRLGVDVALNADLTQCAQLGVDEPSCAAQGMPA